MSRPLVEIDMDKLAALMRFKPTLADCAAFFSCSEDSIARRIREDSDVSFAEFREQKMVHTRMQLVRTALSRSEKSDTMLIFCLKNLCGWRDKQPEEDGPLAVITNNVTPMSSAQMIQLIREAKEEK
jgi:ribosomal 50S subunit-associated protein YjgA (DUF615 family)